ncbi:hypothetical protein ACA910_000269 [Epithemia clementina (nom. ined.)]
MPPHADSGFDYRSLLPSRLQPQAGGASSASNNTNNIKSSYLLLSGSDSGSNFDNVSSSNNSDDISSSWCCDELSFRERMLGFGTCLVAGYMLSFGSFFRIGALVLGNPRPLVIHAAFGNLMAWAGSFFLVGPKAQWKRLWEEKRKLATQVYLSSLLLMLAILIFHPWGPEGLYLFILIILQNAAMTWYCLSYIPYGQETVGGWCSRFISRSASAVTNDLDLSYMPAPV